MCYYEKSSCVKIPLSCSYCSKSYTASQSKFVTQSKFTFQPYLAAFLRIPQLIKQNKKLEDKPPLKRQTVARPFSYIHFSLICGSLLWDRSCSAYIGIFCLSEEKKKPTLKLCKASPVFQLACNVPLSSDMQREEECLWVDGKSVMENVANTQAPSPPQFQHSPRWNSTAELKELTRF